MYADIGGMDIQKQEVREAVELPLTHFELYKQVRTVAPHLSSRTGSVRAEEEVVLLETDRDGED